MATIDRTFLVGLLKKLIRIESVNPNMEAGRGEAEISNIIVANLESIGIDVQTQNVADDRFNVIGILRGEGDGQSLMLNGHTDTVGVKGMLIEPFKPIVVNNNIYGRGACDMKAALAAMITTVKSLVDASIKLKGDLLISAVVDEEYESKGTEKLLRKYHSDAAVVCEPTNLDIAIAHKGFVWFEIETLGKAVHGSVPEAGIDAITSMAKIICQMTSLEKTYKKKKHPLVGIPKIHTSIIEGGSDWSTIPDSCRLKLERRMIPGETSPEVLNEFNQILNKLSKEESSFHAKINKIFERQPMEIDLTEDIVRNLSLAYKKIRGFYPEIVGEPYWSDAALFVNQASIPTCLFGPGDINLAHSARESVNIADVIEAAKIYVQTVLTFCETLQH